jgi:hypothetical protein
VEHAVAVIATGAGDRDHCERERCEHVRNLGRARQQPVMPV